MTPTLISITTLTVFLYWAIKHVGIPTSISSLFYPAKTRWTYTIVIGGIGSLMTLVDPYSLIHYAGISLILGTAAPNFKHESSLSKPLHYGFTGLTALLAWTYIGGIWMGLAGVLLIGVAKLLDKRIANPVFWAEVILFYVTFSKLMI